MRITNIAKMVMRIKPAAVFTKIENTINEYLTEASLAPEFRVEFIIMPQTIQFNLIDENQMKLIIAVVTTMINRLKEMVLTNNKTELRYSMLYPFDTPTEIDNAQVIIDIHYRQDTKFAEKRILVTLAKEI